MNGPGTLDHTTLWVGARRSRVLFDDVDPFDHDPALFGEHFQDLAAFPLVLPAQDLDEVPLSHVQLVLHRFAASISSQCLQDLGSQGNNPHKILVPQFAGDRSKDARPPGVLLVVDDHSRVFIKTDVRTVRPARRLRRPHHDRLDHVALLYDATRGRLFHRSDDDIAQMGVTPVGAAEDADAKQLFGPSVVGYVERALLLNHRALPSFPKKQVSNARDDKSARRLASPLQDLDDSPPLLLGERAGLHHPHAVAHAALVVFVVRLESDRLADGPAIKRVPHEPFDRDDTGFIHLIGDHETFTDLPLTSSLALHVHTLLTRA